MIFQSHNPSPTTCPAPHGMALLLVLWGIAIMGITVMGLIQITQTGIRGITNMERYERALLLAQSGMAIALRPEVTPMDPLLHDQWSDSERFDVLIASEEGRLSVNGLLKEEHRAIWQRLFKQWGLSPTESDTVFDCLLDWVSPGAGRRLNGAIASDYERAGLAHAPTGKPFTSLDELGMVMNFHLLSSRKPDWKDHFTIWGNGVIDVNHCSADVLAAVTDSPWSKAESLVQYRMGPDGIAGTDDDVQFESLPEVQIFLGINEQRFGQIAPLLKLQSTILRLQSRGTAYGKIVQLDAVVRRTYPRSVIYEWTIR